MPELDPSPFTKPTPVDDCYVAAVIAKLPPLTDGARQRIAGLLLAGDAR